MEGECEDECEGVEGDSVRVRGWQGDSVRVRGWQGDSVRVGHNMS